MKWVGANRNLESFLSRSILANVVLFIFSLLLLTPLLAVTGSGFWGLVQWIKLPERGIPLELFIDYARNSLIVLAGSAMLALIWGFVSAYLCARFEFVLRKQVQILAMLPLATPAYLVAYAWVDGLIDWGVPGGLLRTMPMACIILGFTLVPYVFLPTYGSLAAISRSMVEVGKLAGLGAVRSIISIELPLVYPALVGSTLLVGMEVLTDFGTVDYLAIDTWSTGIYRSWYGHADFSRASFLSLVLLLVSVALVTLDFWVRRSKRVAAMSKNSKLAQRTPLSGLRAGFAILILAMPAILVCIIPLGSMSVRFLKSSSIDRVDVHSLVRAAIHSLGLAFGGACLVLVVGIAVAALGRWNTNAIKKLITRLAGLGYALPGGVLAIGLVLVLGPIGLGGTIAGILIAYLIRYLTIGSSTVAAAWERIPLHLEEQARILGQAPSRVFLTVSFPLMKQSLGCAFAISALDMLKELPATMILRPFNFETLSIVTYNLASDERLLAASPAAILLVLMCMFALGAAYWLGAFGFSTPSQTKDTQIQAQLQSEMVERTCRSE